MKSTGARHVLGNTLAGLFLGVGVSLLLSLYGVVGWSTVAPDVIVAIGVLIGLGVGLLPVRVLGEQPAPTWRSDLPPSRY